MVMRKTAYISIPAQIGGIIADFAVASHLMELRKLLEKYCNVSYAEGIDEFVPVFRVDGDVGYWEFEGLQKLRLMKKQRYITIDIGVPRGRWENVPPKLIRQYLLDNLKLALEAFVIKLKKEGISVDDKRLFEDFAKVERSYLI